LIEFFKNDFELNQHFASYFKPVGIDPKKYLFYIMSFYCNLSDKSIYFAYYYNIPQELKEDLKYLDLLSIRTLVQPLHAFDLNEIKKSPFYKLSENEYILLDLGFLIDKAYSLFINDFYFNYLKANKIPYSYYAGKIGYFFENHVSKIL
jgi:hypothetical protein